MAAFYRFRRIDNILGTYQELENQSIFFASPDQLNDPMEGFRDIYWQGDQITWANLFRHYLHCLERAYCLLALSDESQYVISRADLPIFWDGSDFPTEEARKLFDEVAECFFNKARVSSHIEAISSHRRRVRRSELQWYLWTIHFDAIDSIAERYEAHGLISKRSPTETYDGPTADFQKILSSAPMHGSQNEALTEAIFCSLWSAVTQSMLVHRHTRAINPAARNRIFVFIDFPEEYVRAIERLTFPNWYTACFMSECTNSAAWSHYGDNHRGICLTSGARTRTAKASCHLRE